jgi:hypothetical protein
MYWAVYACMFVCGYPGAWACACACVHVPLLIQDAKRMRRIVTFVATQSPPYFSTLAYVINGAILGKKLLKLKCLFWFFYNFCLKHLSFWEEFSEISSKMSKRLHVSTRHSCQILTKLEFSGQFFEEISSNIMFYQNPPSVSRVVPCGRTDGHDKLSHFSQFCERA